MMRIRWAFLAVGLVHCLASGHGNGGYSPSVFEQGFADGNKVFFITGDSRRQGIWHVDQNGNAMEIHPMPTHVVAASTVGDTQVSLRFATDMDAITGYRWVHGPSRFGFALSAAEVFLVKSNGRHVRVQLIPEKYFKITSFNVIQAASKVIDGVEYYLFAVSTNAMRSEAVGILVDQDLRVSVFGPSHPGLFDDADWVFQKYVPELKRFKPIDLLPRDALFTNEGLRKRFPRGRTVPYTVDENELKSQIAEPIPRPKGTVKGQIEKQKQQRQEQEQGVVDDKFSNLKDVNVLNTHGQSVSAISLIGNFARNLTLEYGEAPIEKISGDRKTQMAIAEALANPEGGSPVIVGPPGVGKSMEVELLVSDLVQGRGPEFLLDRIFIAVDARSLETGGAFVGSVMTKIDAMRALSKANYNRIIWVIEEIHSWKGVGTHSGQDSDVIQALKTDMARGRFPFIGTSTLKEIHEAFDDDRAFLERLVLIEKKEPAGEALVAILNRWGEEKNFGTPPAKVVKEVIEISESFDAIGSQPRKAIRLLAAVYARLKVNQEKRDPTVADVREVARDRLGYDEATTDPSQRRLRIEKLAQLMKEKVVGQDLPKRQILNAVVQSYSRAAENDGPKTRLLFVGPEGQGKTMMAKLMAEALNVPIVHIEMNQFPHGAYVGKGPLALAAAAVQKNPYTLLLFDEIEKADVAVQEELLRALNDGKAYVQRELRPGHLITELVDFRNARVVMTSNAASDQLDRNRPGFVGRSSADSSEESVRDLLRHTSLSRLVLDRSEVIAFLPMGKDAFEKAIRNEITQFMTKAAAQGRVIEFPALEDYVKKKSEIWRPGLSMREAGRAVRDIRSVISYFDLYSDQIGPAGKPLTLQFDASGLFIEGVRRPLDCEDLLR